MDCLGETSKSHTSHHIPYHRTPSTDTDNATGAEAVGGRDIRKIRRIFAPRIGAPETFWYRSNPSAGPMESWGCARLREESPMKVFQIGAAGGIGRRLSTLLTGRGDTVTGMHRNPDQAAVIAATGATPVAGDLVTDSVDELAAKFHGHDAIVFSAGAHGTGMDQTSLIDGRGLEKSADAARFAGVARFILVSVFPDAGRDLNTTPAFEHYMRVKKMADAYLVATDLDWLIVRPGTLRNEPGKGLVTAGLAIEYGNVHRDDVAAFIDVALHRPALNRVIIELTDGHTPVADAVELVLDHATTARK
ncbi:SDR family oxidoreductase [Nocardia sp. NPDC059239]|uniref:SDR family oxidoreductase n=1 Tax=unclassified Nocardia TaxID=2637762 RepID=UPI0036831348